MRQSILLLGAALAAALGSAALAQLPGRWVLFPDDLDH
jgi:hypothetical protein